MKNFTAVTPLEQKALGITQLQTTITGNEMDFSSGVIGNGGDFQRRTLFVDNCQSCKKNTMKNLNGYDYYDYGSYGDSEDEGFFDDVTAGGILTQLGGVANSIFQNQAAQSAAEIKKSEGEIKQAEIDLQKAENAGTALENAGAIEKIKAYIVPISIVGGLAILGIATYFIFKKKKID